MMAEDEMIHYGYRIRSSYNSVNYIQCIAKNREQCPAHGEIRNERIIWRKNHNHNPNVMDDIIRQMKKELHEATELSLQDLRSIYNQIVLSHPDAAAFVTFRSIERSMMRWRQAVRPPIPISLENYAEILNDPKWNHLTEYPTGRLNVSTVIGRDSSVATVIGDPQFLQTIVAEEFYIDATYKVCPRKPKFYQLFTIMAKAIPITWALMNNKSTLAYVTS
ncbi:uncharacterized protein LOC123264915 isoform X2 [Cotesia glomerata]|uniref:uncharacterized protein LOC123264915 isoform X2 n=1 Tax=Cotesia glomerata TaxID=32391 RepID=UPI001D0119F3|nr:uncharacterized protein LOC123264915 isoform X2 [Cotesia glomerata]